MEDNKTDIFNTLIQEVLGEDILKILVEMERDTIVPTLERDIYE